MLEFKAIEPTKENILNLEKLRYNAYSFFAPFLDETQSYYFKKIMEEKILAIGAFLNSSLVAGCYISNSHNSLYIEQIFVKKEFQNHKELRIGSSLMKYVLKNKENIEIFFHENFNYAKVEPASNSLVEYYEKLGFHESNEQLDTFHKRI